MEALGLTYLSLTMFTASALAAFVIRLAWRRRAAAGGVEFILLMSAVALYAFFAAFEIMATTIPAKIVWAKLSYLGVVNLAPCWFSFSLAYSHPNKLIKRPRIFWLWLLPLVILGLAFTNEWHGLIWTSFTFDSQNSSGLLIYGHGILFWVHAIYAYLLLLAGTYWLIKSAWQASHMFRWQILLIIAASLIPWAGNILYLFDLSPWPGLDLTPIAFVLSGLFLVVNLYRFHTFELVPVARKIVFNSMGAGVIVLDNQNRLVDINPKAKEWTDLGNEAIGQNLFNLLDFSTTIKQFEDTLETQTLINIDQGDTSRFYQVTISPIYDSQRNVQGRVVLFNDVSSEHLILEREQRRARQMELLNEITQAALSTSEMQLSQTLTGRLGELFGAEGAYLTMWDEENQRVLPTAAYGEMSDLYPAIKVEPGETTLTESALKAGRVIFIEDIHNTPYLSSRIAALFPTRSSIALPLIANNKKLGAAIVSFHQPRQFSPDDVALGEQAAGQIALAIEKVLMYHAERRHNAQLTALQSVSRAVAASLDLNKIFETVVNELQSTFGYPYVSIYLLQDNLLRLGAYVGYPDEMIYKEITIEQGILGRAVRNKQTQFVADVTTDPDFLRATYEVGFEICVPLLKDQTVFGTLNIESPSDQPLTKRDAQLLTSFADQVTVAIDNANLYKAEKHQRELTEALREIGMAMSESLNLDTVLDQLLEAIQRVVFYDRARVILADKDHKRAVLTRLRIQDILASKLNQETVFLEFQISSTPNLQQMAKTGKPLIIGDTEGNPKLMNDPSARHFRSSIGIPITLQREVIGFLLLDKVEAHFFSPEHGRVLAAFASQAAIAVENARLYESERRRRQQAAAIAEVSRDISTSLHLDIVLERIATYAKELLNTETAAVYLSDPARRILKASAAIGPDADEIRSDSIRVGEGILGNIALNKKGEMVNYSAMDPRAIKIEGTEDSTDEHILGAPILSRDQLTGLIAVWRTGAEEEFKSTDLEFLSNLAFQAVIAIENAKLYTEAQHSAIIDELTGIYNRRGLFNIGKQEYERAIRFKHSLVALFLDIDHFKNFNDTYSYAVGDQVLRMFASCLRANLREFDLIGRYGGEEFIVLLPEADLDAATEIAERIRRSVADLRVQTDLGETSITVSIGGYALTPQVPDVGTLFENAGQALHLAKQQGRNRVVIER